MAITPNIIDVEVSKRAIGVKDHAPIVAGNVGVDFLCIALDAEWDDLKVYVTFSGCYYRPTTLDMAEQVEVPWEQITEAGELYMGIRGYDVSADVTIDAEGQLVENGNAPVVNATAMRIPLYVQESGATAGAEPEQPTPDALARMEQDLIKLEQLTDGADETIAKVDAAAGDANEAAASANAAAASVDASKAAAQQAATAANAAASSATAAAGKANAAAGNADTATAAANAATSAANTATSDAIAAEQARDQEFREQLADWQARVDASAIASLMSAVEFGLDAYGNQICYLPVNPGYAFRLNETNDLEVVV